MSELKLGMKAPNFILSDMDGDEVSLDQYIGKKVWLAFFRYASCPVCNLQIARMRAKAQELLGMGICILAVFQSPPASVKIHVGKEPSPFPLLCDTDERVYQLYGLQKSWRRFFKLKSWIQIIKAILKGHLPGRPDGSKNRIPGDFLIDEQGVVQVIYYGRDIGDHVSIEQVLLFGGSSAQSH